MITCLECAHMHTDATCTDARTYTRIYQTDVILVILIEMEEAIKNV